MTTSPTRPRARLARPLLLSLLLAAGAAPAAADSTPLPALADKPVRYGRAAGIIHAVSEHAEQRYYSIRATGSSCLIADMPQYWIDGDAPIHARYTDFRSTPDEQFGIERLITRGYTAELERTTATIEDGVLVPKARSWVTLQQVAGLEGLAVYAYRWKDKVFLIARTTGQAAIRPDGGPFQHEETECSVVYTVLRVRESGSQTVQLRGNVPSTRKQYQIDASISQSGRDPVPLLSVTARLDSE